MGRLIDLSGQRFGRLTVLERAPKGKNHNPRWKCRCDCGKEIIVIGQQLRSGRTKSCGCLRREVTTDDKTRHGGRHTRLYRVWAGMKERCYNPNHKEYSVYGGRGITVCDAWRNDFAAFREWALQAGYDKTAPRGACTIDRIDNDKGYSPENCRWLSLADQQRNRRPRKKG